MTPSLLLFNVRFGSFADLRSARSNVLFFHNNCYHSVIPPSDFNCSAGVRQEGWGEWKAILREPQDDKRKALLDLPFQGMKAKVKYHGFTTFAMTTYCYETDSCVSARCSRMRNNDNVTAPRAETPSKIVKNWLQPSTRSATAPPMKSKTMANE